MNNCAAAAQDSRGAALFLGFDSWNAFVFRVLNHQKVHVAYCLSPTRFAAACPRLSRSHVNSLPFCSAEMGADNGDESEEDDGPGLPANDQSDWAAGMPSRQPPPGIGVIVIVQMMIGPQVGRTANMDMTSLCAGSVTSILSWSTSPPHVRYVLVTGHWSLGIGLEQRLG
jgi:hypothetical protein